MSYFQVGQTDGNTASDYARDDAMIFSNAIGSPSQGKTSLAQETAYSAHTDSTESAAAAEHGPIKTRTGSWSK
jgi:hypothetical protein